MSLVGRLEDLGLSDIFQILSVGKKTGALLIRGSQGSAMIIFKNGLVVRAESSAGESTIGNDLLKAGHIKQSTLDLASGLKDKLPGKSIADILFELGAVKKDALEKLAKKRMERLIAHMLQWQDGDFQFELDDVDVNGQLELQDRGWEISKGLSPEYLLMEGARVFDEASYGISVTAGEPAEEEEQAQEEEWDTDWSGGHKRKDISSLRALTQELRFPNSASEIILLILRFASDIFQRGVLFKVGESEISGLGQFGLDVEDADQKIRQTVIPLGDSGLISRVIKEGHLYRGPLGRESGVETLTSALGGGHPAEAVLFPIIAEGKAVALLYSDNTSEGVGETEGLEIFISQAGLALEKAMLHSKLQDLQRERNQ